MWLESQLNLDVMHDDRSSASYRGSGDGLAPSESPDRRVTAGDEDGPGPGVTRYRNRGFLLAYRKAFTVAPAAFLCFASGLPSLAGGVAGNVFGWGEVLSGTNYVPISVPAGLTNVASLDSRGGNTLALKADGSVIAFGETKYDLANVPSIAGAQVMSVAAGWYHSLVLKSNGTLVAWGDGASGKTNVPAAAQSGVVAIAAGANHSLAVKADGSVVAWGFNTYGQSKVPSGLGNAIAVAAGATHSLALKADRTVVAWGQNNLDQTRVPASCTNVVAIAAGDYHNLALRADGTVVAWGSNYDARGAFAGQIKVPKDLTNAVAVAAGGYHSLALKSDGTVVAWGSDLQGQTEVPEQNGVLGISAGESFSLGITALPVIVLPPPDSVQVMAGVNVTLNVSVASSAALNCQWYFNDLPLPGATALSLAVTNFDLSMAGSYSVVVSNSYGTAEAVSVLRLTNSPVVLVDDVDVGGGRVDRIDSSEISMNSALGANAVIHYTLDGTAPDFTDFQYQGPFFLTNSAVVRAIAYTLDYARSVEAAAIEVEVRPTYPLLASTLGGGSLVASPAAFSDENRYISNTVVTLTATPAAAWLFLNWTGDSQGTNPVTSVLMDGPHQVQAVFGRGLTLVTNGIGAVLLNPPSGPYAFGSTVQATALPAPSSYFFGWAGAATGFINPLTLTVTNTSGLTALFGTLGPNDVSLTVLPDGSGRVTVSPSKKFYTNGEAVLLTALPITNSVFSGWGGAASGRSNPLALTLLSNTLVTANFVAGTSTNPPLITQPPLSRTLNPSSDTILAVGVSGDGPFYYQWRFGGTTLPGATSSTLNLTDLTTAQAGLYDVIVTGSSGMVTSPAASVALFSVNLGSSAEGTVPVLTLDGAVGSSYRVEFSGENQHLTNWTLLVPTTLQSHSFLYTDAPITNHPMRLYRAVPQ